MKSLSLIAVLLVSLTGCLLPPKEVVSPTKKTPAKQPTTVKVEDKDSFASANAQAMELCATGRFSCWQGEDGRWVLDPLPQAPTSAPVIATVTPASAPTVVVTPTPPVQNKPDLKTPETDPKVQESIADLEAKTNSLHEVDVMMYDLLQGFASKGLPVLPGYNLVKYTTEMNETALASFDTGVPGMSFKTCQSASRLVRVKNAYGANTWIVPYVMVGTKGVRTEAIGDGTSAYFCAPKGTGKIKVRIYADADGFAQYIGTCSWSPFKVEKSGNPLGSADLKVSDFSIEKDGSCKWGPE